MNKKIILGLGSSLLVASSLLAFNPQSGMQGCDGMGQGMKCGSKFHKMQKRGMHKKRGGFMSMVMNLDLSTKQRTQIKEIIMASRKDMPKPSDAFSDTKFDKEKFIKLATQKREAKIKLRAEVMSKVYKVLNSSQKKDLKTMMDMKQLMKKKMMQRKLDMMDMKPVRAM